MFTLETTKGYTQAELNALNVEMARRLAEATADTKDDLTENERWAIVTRCEFDIARA